MELLKRLLVLLCAIIGTGMVVQMLIRRETNNRRIHYCLLVWLVQVGSHHHFNVGRTDVRHSGVRGGTSFTPPPPSRNFFQEKIVRFLGFFVKKFLAENKEIFVKETLAFSLASPGGLLEWPFLGPCAQQRSILCQLYFWTFSQNKRGGRMSTPRQNFRLQQNQLPWRFFYVRHWFDKLGLGAKGGN